MNWKEKGTINRSVPLILLAFGALKKLRLQGK
jgi:hypothetical protein